MTYLDRVLTCIKNQTYQPDKLIVIYDGVSSDFVAVRNKVTELDIPAERIVIVSDNISPVYTIYERRINIANNHNKIRDLIVDGLVWSIEDDGILPNNALEKLLNDTRSLTKKGADVGMVTGVELGRWGNPYVGAWRVDDVFTPKSLSSLESKAESTEIEKIDGCGLYCCLMRADLYRMHTFFCSNGLGPDVNLGFFMRQHGFENYIDWSIHVTHLTHMHNEEIEIPATSPAKVVEFTLLSGTTWKH